MMSLQNAETAFYAEFDALRNQMDEIFRNMGLSSNIRSYTRGFPQLNVGSTEDAFEIVAFAPGIDPATLQATIENGLLTIAGERVIGLPNAGKGVNIHARERHGGPFRRVVELPRDADPDRVTARYADGCLRITVLKRESSKPRLIAVQ